MIVEFALLVVFAILVGVFGAIQLLQEKF